MCSRADLDRRLVATARHGRAHVGQRLVGVGRVEERLVDRPGSVGGQLLEPRHRLVVGPVDLRLARFAEQVGVREQGDPLTPMVEGGQLSDDREDRVGQAEVVLGWVGQVLDLPHHVVAEVPDQPAVHRRQPVERRRAVHGQQRLERREHALVERDAVGQAAPGHLQATVAGDQGRRGAAAHEGPAAPLVAVLDRLEQEPGLVVRAQPGEGGHRRDEVGQQLAPHRDDGVVAGQGPELVPAGPDHPSAPAPPKARKKQVRLPGVARPLALLLDDEQQHVAVAVVGRPAHELAVTGGVALAPHLLARAAPEHRAALLEALAQGGLGHPGHHQHLTRALVLHDGGHQTVGVVLHRVEVGLADRDGRGRRHGRSWYEGVRRSSAGFRTMGVTKSRKAQR